MHSSNLVKSRPEKWLEGVILQSKRIFIQSNVTTDFQKSLYAHFFQLL